MVQDLELHKGLRLLNLKEQTMEERHFVDLMLGLIFYGVIHKFK